MSGEPMPAFVDRLRRDLADTLRCPDCKAEELEYVPPDIVHCRCCRTDHGADGGAGVGVFLAGNDDDLIKEDVKAWWGDLYNQAYAAHLDSLDAAAVDVALDELEDLFRRRQHLCTTEMPLSSLGGKRVLEIGSGSGAHSALFKRAGAMVTAVDITPERVVGTARLLALTRGGSGNTYQADAENLPFRDGSFDIVYSNGVLHHSPDTDRGVAEVHRVLRPGGLAVIMLYARHSTVFWLNIVPRAVLSGEMFRWPEARWIGRLTEGKPKFGTTRNPITRVYSKDQVQALFRSFEVRSLRQSSFQFDNFAVPRLTQIRARLLQAIGHRPHPGGLLVYGGGYMTETALELWLGRHIGWCWNIVAAK